MHDPSDMPMSRDATGMMEDHEPGEHMRGRHMMMGQQADEDEHEEEGPGPVTESPGQLSGEVTDGVRVVKVAARRFAFIPDTIVVKAGEPVRLEVTSTDVTHGIDLEGMQIDVVLPPNQPQHIEFTPEKPGTYHFHCSVYCGPGHQDMHGELIVVP